MLTSELTQSFLSELLFATCAQNIEPKNGVIHYCSQDYYSSNSPLWSLAAVLSISNMCIGGVVYSVPNVYPSFDLNVDVRSLIK